MLIGILGKYFVFKEVLKLKNFFSIKSFLLLTYVCYKLLNIFNLRPNISQIFILTRPLLEEHATLNLVFQGTKFIFCVAWTYFTLIFTFSDEFVINCHFICI